MRLFEKIDRWMLRRFPRYRLCRICKAIGIKPYWWQKEFALGKFDYLPRQLRNKRGNGKTTAVMLRVLMIPVFNADAVYEAGRIIRLDPDFSIGFLRWWRYEYKRLRGLCLSAGIPAVQIDFFDLMNKEYRKSYKTL